MKTIITTTIILLSFVSMQAQEKSDKELIKETIISAYQDGLLNEGNAAKIDAGFHEDFEMLGINKDGEMYRYHINDWKANNDKKLADGRLPKKGKDKVKIEIPMIDVTGIAAVAKIDFFVDGKKVFVDYQSLYKLNGKWKIVAKIYHTVEN
jgi:hypothetical protein